MTRSYFKCSFVLSAWFFLPLKLFAWNALGHMVIASVAYQNLQPTTKANIDNLVMHFSKEYPYYYSLMHMAYWLDTVRGQRIDMFTRWHYIDVPFGTDKSIPLKNTISCDNASWAVSSIKHVLQNPRANVYEQARFLAFMVHIVGDLHQPLHTVTRISKALPDGDKGGNLVKIKFKGRKIKLHKLWDDGLGLLAGDANIANANRIANTLMTQYPSRHFGNKVQDLTPATWEKEGMDNALSTVYAMKEDEEVSPQYIVKGQTVVQQELTLAGYRLAAMLNHLLP